MKMKLLALTPVHIGTGNTLEPFEYVVQQGIFSRISQDRAFSLCIDKYADFPEKFFAWIDRKSSDLIAARGNQAQNQVIRNFNIREFILTEYKDKELAAAVITQGSAYSCAAMYGFTVNKQVAECMKSTGNQPYIPGSSVKGAVKTALLYRSLMQMNPNDAKNLIYSVKKTNAWRNPRSSRGLDEPLMKYFFICGNQEFASSRTDALYDIMKFIRISDAGMDSGDMAVYPAAIILPDKEPQKQLNPQEAITRGSAFSFTITVGVTELKTILSKKHQGWSDLQAKFKRVFGVDPAAVSAENLEAEVVKSIRDALQKFSESQLLLEEKWTELYRHTLKVEGKPDTTNADYSVVKRFYETFIKSKPYIRIGWGSGFQATTIYTMLLTTDDLKKFTLEMFHLYGIGIPPGRANADKKVKNLDKFPKSRRVTIRDIDHPVYPFGWMVMLNDTEQFTVPEINESEENYFLGKGAPEAKKKEEKLTDDQYTERNKNRVYVIGDIVEAKYGMHQKSTVALILCDPRYREKQYLDKPLMISYGAADRLQQERIFRVKIKAMKNGAITTVEFHSFIG